LPRRADALARLPGYRRGAALQRRGGVVEAVLPGAAQGQEQAARADAAAVQLDAGDVEIGHRRGIAFEQAAQRASGERGVHGCTPVVSAAATAGAPAVCKVGVCGCRSGGICSRRAAPAMTRANTGADTAPP